MPMTAQDYRDSLRRYAPRVFIDGSRIDSVVDEPLLAPGIAAVGVTYDFAARADFASLMLARQGTSEKTVSRMLHINDTPDDLLLKLEAVRLVCQESGCAQRYLAHDALNGLFQATKRADCDYGTDFHDRFVDYLNHVQDADLALGIAMTDAKGDRSKRPGAQANRDAYVHVAEKRPDGIIIRGTKAIVTGAPYMHEFLVLPCRTHTPEDSAFAVACAVPVDAPGVTIVARPAGRPGESAAKLTGKYGQSTGVVHFDDVFVPHERTFLMGQDRGMRLSDDILCHPPSPLLHRRAGWVRRPPDRCERPDVGSQRPGSRSRWPHPRCNGGVDNNHRGLLRLRCRRIGLLRTRSCRKRDA